MPVEKSTHIPSTRTRANTPKMRDINTGVRATQALQWSVPNLLLLRYMGHVGLPLRAR